MKTQLSDQVTILDSQDTHLQTWIEAFLYDRKAQGLSRNTLNYYRKNLAKFAGFCDSLLIKHITELTPHNLRQFLVQLEEQGHNAGGIHGFYRAIRAFLYWWEAEIEPEFWKNPIRKVKSPKVETPLLSPVPVSDIQVMLDTCENDLLGLRDRAILLCLLDTGVRASELCAMNLDDLDRVHGAILIPNSKSKRPRTVFLGKKSRKALRAYLRRRRDDNLPVWITNSEERLTYWGLRQIVRRRAEKAGVDVPSLHDFRRAFALECLRNGMDVYSLQKLMGHADLQVLRRYLAQTTEDIQQAHQHGSPVDNAGI